MIELGVYECNFIIQFVELVQFNMKMLYSIYRKGYQTKYCKKNIRSVQFAKSDKSARNIKIKCFTLRLLLKFSKIPKFYFLNL